MPKQKTSNRWKNYDPRYIYSLVVRRYFSEMKTKIEIAEELGVSRFKVARLIDEAIAQDYVRFIFPKQQAMDDEIAGNLREKYHLDDALVLSVSESWSTQDELNDKLGGLSANYLSETLKEGMKIGIAWGRVLSSTVSKLTSLPALDVVQLSGVHPGIEFSQGPIDLIHKLAAISHGKAHPMYVPMWVDDESLAGKLSDDQAVLDTQQYYSHLDVVITGIGNWKSGSSSLCHIFPESWRNTLISQDIAADVCITLVNSKGEVLDSPMNRLGFGISTEQLQKTKKVIGVAGGEEKYEGIVASLKSGLLNVLITDFDTAIKLLD
ncbi:sugar-binding transcriptional regulator [Entomohabitans teleogrylli]|uniref:sugar-binding transcriptional regulator n=1 Tax=Entomohabitans teleogrylli TaxID=1384589 RepID=UPI00073D8407|nr:sugar-binding domain-containing protein [Entomohabitans teleogrylli]